MDWTFIVLILFILGSGFFSGAEIALFTLSRVKVLSLVDQQRKNAELLQRLKAEPQKLLITILIGNNLVNIGASSLATLLAIEKFGNAGAGIATGAMTFLILLFGEIIPKSIAQKYATVLALRFSPLLRFLITLFLPVTYVLDAITQFVQRVFGLQGVDVAVSEADVKAMVALGHKEGAVEEDEREMIENVFGLNDLKAADIMTPMAEVEGFMPSVDIETVLQVAVETGYSRFPIFTDKKRSSVSGILLVKDLFAQLTEEALHAYNKNEKIIPHVNIEENILPPVFVRYNERVDELLNDLLREHTHIAVVQNEQKQMIGIVTLEDLVEEIVGDIFDESDREDQEDREELVEN